MRFKNAKFYPFFTLNTFSLNTYDIMNISGHKTEKVLLGYINVTEEQHAMRWTQTDYFKKVNRKHLRIA